MASKKREIVKYLSGMAAVLSICFSCYSFYRATTSAPATAGPATTRLVISHSDQGTFFSWEQIPGSAPILQGTLEPHDYGGTQVHQPEPPSQLGRANDAPTRKIVEAKSAPWEYWARIYVQGDSDKDGASMIVRQSCAKDRPLVCYLPGWARDRIVVDAF
jgi:hypothetical protein